MSRCSMLILRLVLTSVVIAVVHAQLPSVQIMIVQISHSGCRCICVCELQEPISLRLPALFIIDQSESHHGTAATENVAYLFLAYT